MAIKLNDCMNALELEILRIFPGATIYRNVMPKNFQRPSFYVEMVKFSMVPAEGTPCAVCRSGKFRLVAFEAIDDYHNSQVDDLDDKLDRLAGIFAPGFLPVEDRAIHAGITDGQILSTDAAELTVELTWLEDLADYVPDPEEDAETLEAIVSNLDTSDPLPQSRQGRDSPLV